jgi:hypothetical protein
MANDAVAWVPAWVRNMGVPVGDSFMEGGERPRSAFEPTDNRASSAERLTQAQGQVAPME